MKNELVLQNEWKILDLSCLMLALLCLCKYDSYFNSRSSYQFGMSTLPQQIRSTLICNSSPIEIPCLVHGHKSDACI